jgi:tRNA 5-methylaminomethyl-2-thiouridine biosynthesis bifunctional protein
VTPRLDAGLGPPAALFANAFARARDLYRSQADAEVSSGVLQLAVGEKDARRFAAIARSDLFEPGEVRLADAAETSRLLGEPSPLAVVIESGLVVRPASVLAAWLGNPECARVASLGHENAAWRLIGLGGEILAEAEIVCVACGMAAADLVPGLPLRPVRGQASFIAGAEIPAAALFGGYVAPAPGGVICGATHDRDDEGLEPRDGDHRRNLAVLAGALPGLAARLASAPAEPYVGIRATTADYLPIAGAAPDSPPGLFVLTGLGSRGYTLAPLLAEHVAGLALGAPSPLPRSQAALVDPSRFAQRARRRGR